MKSSFIEFVEKYKNTKLSEGSLLIRWKKEIDKTDFDRNEKEVFTWFKSLIK